MRLETSLIILRLKIPHKLYKIPPNLPLPKGGCVPPLSRGLRGVFPSLAKRGKACLPRLRRRQGRFFNNDALLMHSLVRNEGGSLRQIVMDLLYRFGELKGIEIGEIMRSDYSTISQGRKRLSEKIKKDRNLRVLLNRIEKRLSI